jgi:hypothetical protein
MKILSYKNILFTDYKAMQDFKIKVSFMIPDFYIIKAKDKKKARNNIKEQIKKYPPNIRKIEIFNY